MPANSGLPDTPQRISVVCDCGKKLVANSMQSGKRLKCPSCGQVIVVPPVGAGSVPAPTRAASEPQTSEPQTATGKRRLMRVLLMIGLWSLPVVAAIGGGAFLHFDAKWRQHARIDAANTEVREAVQGAAGWLKQGRAKEGENVEHRLMKAIAANDVSEKANADAVLDTVRTRRAELAADSIFDSAKTKLDAKAIVEAVALLHRYVADRHATKKPEAKQLLADYDLAKSDSAEINTLVALSDERFVQFRNTGKLDDRQITHPILAEIRAATLRRNLETANQRREANKIAEANRQESERLALAAARRAAEAAKANDPVELIRARPLFSGRPAEFIWARMVGRWGWGSKGKSINWALESQTVPGVAHWRQTGNSIDFAQDGTFDYYGPSPEEYERALLALRRFRSPYSPGSIADGTLVYDGPPPEVVISRGLWRVGQDGTIRVAFKDKLYADVRLLSGGKLSIVVTDPNGRSRHVEGERGRGGNGPLIDAAVEDRYVDEQMQTLVGRLQPARRQAADNLTALGQLARRAAPELVKVALNDGDKLLKRKAIEALGEMDEPQAIPTIAELVRSRDPEIRKAAEDSLLKLLPNVGRRLSMDGAIVLLKVHRSGNKRVLPAIESAWAASGVTQDAVANETNRRAHAASMASAASARLSAGAKPSVYEKCITPDGVVFWRKKPGWVLWREAHPEEASLEIQKAAAQMRGNEERLGRIQFKGTSEAELERQRAIQRQNAEAAANRAR
jgi:hypothetical protein